MNITLHWIKPVYIFFGYVLLSLHTSPALYAESLGTKQGTLFIEIEGMKNDKGLLRISLVNSEEDFRKEQKTFMAKELKINKRTNSCIFTGVPYGEYAVKLYHDENENRKLDKIPVLGIPVERYGFSNNVRSAFGPPQYRDAAFNIETSKTTLKIIVR